MFTKRFKGQKNLLIKVPASVLNDKSIDFVSNRDCYLSRAVREQFNLPLGKVYTDPECIAIDGVFYDILGGMGSSNFLSTWTRDESYEFCGEYVLIPLKRHSGPLNSIDEFMVQQTL